MWKPIKGWEEYYSVNELGEVKNNKTNKLIKGDVNNAGYYRVSLCDKTSLRKGRYFRHRLVAEHFIDNPNNLSEVNHIDGDKSNNCVDNLEWIDRTANERHSRRELGNKEYKPFKVIYKDGREVIYETKLELAEELDISVTSVKNYLHDRSKGYMTYNIICQHFITKKTILFFAQSMRGLFIPISM